MDRENRPRISGLLSSSSLPSEEFGGNMRAAHVSAAAHKEKILI